jgi:hypothetical protein
MKGLETVAKAVAQRTAGSKPSRLRSTASAAVAGGLVAVTVYRGLRS